MMKAALSMLILSAAASAIAADAPTRPDLREELLRMRDVDQRARGGSGGAPDPQAMVKVDAEHTARLKEIVAKEGWPTKSMVGEDGALAAWLLAQHADRDRAFQADVLARIEKLLDSGEVSRKNYAYLYDRINEPQRYGTQGMCVEPTRWAPRAIEDEGKVDKRRAEVGLPPIAEYIALISGKCAEIAAAAPQPPKP
ncbi:DUF6624 domain-containing protein [Massilia sp. METH4]|uniref:DUF6624 domain-containing protein n=1 Tax=Massilia sp. METH4 TaxID=3123041 RepID=UPI0030D35CE6